MSKVPENMTRQELLEAIKEAELENQKLESVKNKLESEKNKLESEWLRLEKEYQEAESAKRKLDADKQKLESVKDKLESENQYLKFRIDQLNRLLFGDKRERFISGETHGQLALPFEVETKEEEPVKTEEITYTRKKKERKDHPGRMPLPDHLPVQEIVIEPEEDTTGMKCIGKEVTDQLEYTPAKLFIKRYIRPRYIKSDDEALQTFKGVIASLPGYATEKCIAGPGLLAQIMVDKYVDHLPIHRQLQRFAREDVHIPSNTMNGWQDKASRSIELLYKRQLQLVLGQGYLQVDETPIRVLDKEIKGKCHQGYYWVYNSPIQRSVIFDYRKGRGREGPKEMLRDFRGYLQSDGYSVYDWFGQKKDISLVNCWAHARRYFEKALQYDKKPAEYVMTQIQLLYKIERFAKNMDMAPAERKELRLDHALPILNAVGKWMAENFSKHLPKSPMGEALRYTVPRWDNLLAYLYDGHLEIDNNLVENAIRPTALGRKNYLFAGSHEAAQRAAMFYSFFGTCKKNNVNPYLWLKDVLERLPNHKVNKLDELLPQNWKTLKEQTLPQ